MLLSNILCSLFVGKHVCRNPKNIFPMLVVTFTLNTFALRLKQQYRMKRISGKILSTYLSIYLSTYLSIHPSIDCLSTYYKNYLFCIFFLTFHCTFPLNCLSTIIMIYNYVIQFFIFVVGTLCILFIYLSIYLSVCLTTYNICLSHFIISICFLFSPLLYNSIFLSTCI